MKSRTKNYVVVRDVGHGEFALDSVVAANPREAGRTVYAQALAGTNKSVHVFTIVLSPRGPEFRWQGVYNPGD